MSDKSASSSSPLRLETLGRLREVWQSSRESFFSSKDEQSESAATATAWDVYWLGLCTVLGMQFFLWNTHIHEESLSAFLCALLLSLASSFSLSLSLAEMTSALPFSGGVYGFVRVTTTPLCGYLVAISALLQSVSVLAVTLLFATQTARELFSLPVLFEPILLVVALLAIALGQLVVSERLLTTTKVLGVLVLVVFLLSLSLSFVLSPSITEYHLNKLSHTFSAKELMEQLPRARWMTTGIEWLPLSCAFCAKPRKEVPKALMGVTLTLSITALFAFFVCAVCTQPSLTLATRTLPLTACTRAVLSLCAMLCVCYGVLCAVSRQLLAMRRSGLVSLSLSVSPASPAHNTVYNSQSEKEQEKDNENESVRGSLFLGVNFVLLLSLPIATLAIFPHTASLSQSLRETLFLCGALGGAVTHAFTTFSYIELRRKYSTLSRSFVSPCGSVCASLTILFSLFAFAADSAQPSSTGEYWAVIAFFVFMIIVCVWYYVRVRHCERFSLEEQTVMFSAYVIKSNLSSKKRIRKKSRSASVVSPVKPQRSQSSLTLGVSQSASTDISTHASLTTSGGGASLSLSLSRSLSGVEEGERERERERGGESDAEERDDEEEEMDDEEMALACSRSLSLDREAMPKYLHALSLSFDADALLDSHPHISLRPRANKNKEREGEVVDTAIEGLRSLRDIIGKTSTRAHEAVVSSIRRRSDSFSHSISRSLSASHDNTSHFVTHSHHSSRHSHRRNNTPVSAFRPLSLSPRFLCPEGDEDSVTESDKRRDQERVSERVSVRRVSSSPLNISRSLRAVLPLALPEAENLRMEVEMKKARANVYACVERDNIECGVIGEPDIDHGNFCLACNNNGICVCDNKRVCAESLSAEKSYSESFEDGVWYGRDAMLFSRSSDENEMIDLALQYRLENDPPRHAFPYPHVRHRANSQNENDLALATYASPSLSLSLSQSASVSVSASLAGFGSCSFD